MPTNSTALGSSTGRYFNIASVVYEEMQAAAGTDVFQRCNGCNLSGRCRSLYMDERMPRCDRGRRQYFYRVVDWPSFVEMPPTYSAVTWLTYEEQDGGDEWTNIPTYRPATAPAPPPAKKHGTLRGLRLPLP